MREIKNTKFHIRLPLILAVGIAAGILIGARMVDHNASDNDLFSSVLKFREVLTHVERDYVDEVSMDELVETAINKMLEKLDPHTVYISSEDVQIAKDQLEGEFEGIGIEFNIIKDTIYVVAPLSGGPSEKVGLLSGDKIITVNEKNVAGANISNREVMELLRGPKGTEVEVGIKRSSEKDLLDFTIERDKIPQHSVDVSYMVNEEVGYIKVSRFAATTYDEFKQAIEDLADQGMKKLILDLQGNPGGYMDRAINIADEFLRADKLIVYTEGKKNKYDTEARSTSKGDLEDDPLIVLIDEGSASASEIVAGALQDNDRALIVGRRSFGKGLVQIPISLNDGSELRLTISRYYTPSGRSIQKPYDSGVSEYNHDQIERFEHGELFYADSIKFNDSLKYKTSKGRTVYGGGGIMPDVFVPLDTSANSEYFRKMFYSNAIREFTLNYYELHKEKLNNMSQKQFINQFEITDKMLNQIIDLAKDAGVAYDQEGFLRSKSLIRNRVKAQIARSIWQNEGFYPIINQTNEAFQHALGLFDEAQSLASK
ncbi:MAG: S41 family peptidase [Candidatus Cyclobacteriaceae bacterium M3_2C_046]